MSPLASSNIIPVISEIAGITFPPGSELNVEYVNNKKEGVGKVISKKRMVIAILNFHDDKVDGFCSFRNDRGEKVKECVFEHGVHNGWGREYSDDAVIFEGIYENGQRYSSLEVHREIPGYFEEKKDGETFSICKFNPNHKREGICYDYENNRINQIAVYENGVKKRVLIQFIDKNRMIENDNNGRMIYKGEYKGNVKNGYQRNGKGMVYTYKDGIVSQVDHMENSVKQGYDIIEGSRLKKYWNNNMYYDGEYCIDDDNYITHGNGVYYYSPSHFYQGVFEKNHLVRKIREINGKIMIEYDDKGKAVYKGGFDNKNYERKGDGLLFEYEGKKMIVYSCENSMRMNKLKEIKNNQMSEFDENGLKVYEGEYKGEVESEFVRDGEGDVFDSNDELLFSGHWKNGKRDGEGMCYRNGVLYYKGNWSDNKPNGKGRLVDENGDTIFEGSWKNGYGDLGKGIWLSYEDGKKCGLYKNGNRKYEGEWKDGKPNGRGVWFDENGNKKYEGEWKNGMIEIEKGVLFDYESGNTCLMNERGVIV